MSISRHRMLTGAAYVRLGQTRHAVTNARRVAQRERLRTASGGHAEPTSPHVRVPKYGLRASSRTYDAPHVVRRPRRRSSLRAALRPRRRSGLPTPGGTVSVGGSSARDALVAATAAVLRFTDDGATSDSPSSAPARRHAYRRRRHCGAMRIVRKADRFSSVDVARRGRRHA
jgi:hypothetical protein